MKSTTYWILKCRFKQRAIFYIAPCSVTTSFYRSAGVVQLRCSSVLTPRSDRAATLRWSSRSSTIWKRLGSGRICADRRLNRAIWQIVVFITTLLRCHYVKHAADTLLLRCYADRCRPEAAFTAFTLRCRYDIQDPTTTLRRPRWLYDDIATVVPIILRLYYASSTILAMMYICLRLETYFSLISKLQTWTDVLIIISELATADFSRPFSRRLRGIFICKCNKM